MGWLCKVMGHKHAKRVWHDGIDFRARCVRCGDGMLRDDIRGEWRLFDPVQDADPSRMEKPERQSRTG
ncbi:hypothetical protein GGQ81_001923 [Sphingomonas desiccabilis]|nr:hypothetical protein [Sphingomonas desiccabilis]